MQRWFFSAVIAGLAMLAPPAHATLILVAPVVNLIESDVEQFGSFTVTVTAAPQESYEITAYGMQVFVGGAGVNFTGVVPASDNPLFPNVGQNIQIPAVVLPGQTLNVSDFGNTTLADGATRNIFVVSYSVAANTVGSFPITFNAVDAFPDPTGSFAFPLEVITGSIEVAPIPEPSTYALLGVVSMVSGGMWYRRRRATKAATTA